MSPRKLQKRAEPLESLRTPDSEEHAHDLPPLKRHHSQREILSVSKPKEGIQCHAERKNCPLSIFTASERLRLLTGFGGCTDGENLLVQWEFGEKL